MTKVILDNIYAIFGAILLASFVGYIAWRNNRKNRIAEVSIKFRSKILTELEGLYPITHYWDESMFKRLRQSILKIESITTEFRYFIPFYHRRTYDKAVKEYCEYCNKITWADIASYSFWPNFPKARKSPKEKFKHIVEHLLSFAKD